MSVREYIGARYVPLFIGEWDDTVTYEPLSVVQYQGDSYTSRQFVPVGIDIDNGTYWAETGNYNAQVEAYRQEVQTLGGTVSTLSETVAGWSDDLAAEVSARENADTALDGRITALAGKYPNIISFDDLDLTQLPSEKTLVIVDNGELNDVDGIIFPSNIEWLFVNGTLDGTFTIAGTIQAPSNMQIFGDNAIVTKSANNYFYPVEWFGIVADDESAATKNTTIMNRIFNDTNSRYKLRNAFYYVNGTVQINKSGVNITGTKTEQSASNITSLNGSAPILKVGDESLYASQMKNLIRIEDVNLRYSTAATSSSAICLQVISVSGSSFVNMTFSNCITGVQVSNAVGCRFEKCHFNLSTANTDNGICCFDAPKVAQYHFFAYGENPSLHIDGCSASLSSYTAGSYGFRFRAQDRGPADLFINDFSLTNFEYGCYFDVSNISTNIHGAQDINLTNLVFDAVRCGVKLYTSTGKWAPIQMNIADSYISTNPTALDNVGIDIYSEQENDYRYVQLTMSGCVIETPENARLKTTGMICNARGVMVNGCSFRYFTKILRGHGSNCSFKFSMFTGEIENTETCVVFDGTNNIFEPLVFPHTTSTGNNIIGTMFDCASAITNSVFNIAGIAQNSVINMYADKASFANLLSTPYVVNASNNSQIGV